MRALEEDKYIRQTSGCMGALELVPGFPALHLCVCEYFGVDSADARHLRQLYPKAAKAAVPLPCCVPHTKNALDHSHCLAPTIRRSYLPEATVAFVDEIFKANSAILNTLLTLLNERLFDNGSTRVHVPLLCLVSYSGAGAAAKALMGRVHRMKELRLAGCSAFLGQGMLAAPVSLNGPLNGELRLCCAHSAPTPCSCRWAPPTSCPRARSCLSLSHSPPILLHCFLCRWARPTSCPRVRSWTRCTTASCCAAACSRSARRGCWRCWATAAGASRWGRGNLLKHRVIVIVAHAVVASLLMLLEMLGNGGGRKRVGRGGAASHQVAHNAAAERW